jgi:adenosylcobinamide-GDP ribazoletransferase
VRAQLRALSIALAFLTLLPTPVTLAASPREDGRSLVYFPLVGLIIGSLLAAASIAVQGLAPMLAAVVVLALWVGLTGALHLDGLADSADAWLGGIGDRDRTLAIMKDPHCGAIAVVVLVLVLLSKFVALAQLLPDGRWQILVAAPLLARGALVWLFVTTPYVRPQGIMSDKLSHAPRRAVFAMVGLTLIVALLLLPAGVPAILLAVVLVVWLLRRAMLHRLGGTTGDTAGALVELVEVSVLLVAAAFLVDSP